MVEDLGHSDVSLVGILLVQVVAANPDSQSAGRLTVTAVSGSDDPVGSDKGSSTHERAANSSSEQSNLVRELPRVGLSATYNSAASTSHGGGQELGTELLGGAGGEGHEAKEGECSHDAES